MRMCLEYVMKLAIEKVFLELLVSTFCLMINSAKYLVLYQIHNSSNFGVLQEQNIACETSTELKKPAWVH